MFCWYRHTGTWILSISPSLSFLLFRLSYTHPLMKIKGLLKWIEFFSGTKRILFKKQTFLFFLFTHLLRGFFLLSVIVIMFWYSFSFYTMPSSSFLHFCRTFLLLLLFKFIILCQRHDIDESNKKERPVLQTKSSSNYIRIQKICFKQDYTPYRRHMQAVRNT